MLRPSEALDALGIGAAPRRTRPSGGVNDALPWTPPLGVLASRLTAAQVSTYQGTLRALGLLTAPASGTVDAATRAAVREFQGWWNAGASNIAASNPARQLVTQGRNNLGALVVDGDLGPRTQQALSLLWRWPRAPWEGASPAPAVSSSTARQIGAENTTREGAQSAVRVIDDSGSFLGVGSDLLVQSERAGEAIGGALTRVGDSIGDAAYNATHATPGSTPARAPAPGTPRAPTLARAPAPNAPRLAAPVALTPAPDASAALMPSPPPTPSTWSTGEKVLVGTSVGLALFAVLYAATTDGQKNSRRS